MIVTPGLTGIPRIGPNGGIVIRSALAGPLVEVGAVGGGSSPLAFRSQFEEEQELNAEIVADISGAAVTFLDVPVGAYVFCQCVMNLIGDAGVGTRFIDPRVVWLGTTIAEDIIWQTGAVVWTADEGPTFGKLPMQFQTPPVDAPQASLTVKIQASGICDVGNGNFQAELILP